jgi:phosphatidylglycerophosphatase A
MKNRTAEVLATWFGCGYFPVAPGTAGSLGAIVPAWLAAEYAGWPPYVFAIAAVLITVPGVWAASIVERNLGREDPGVVVIDEVAGQWLTLAGAHVINWKTVLLAFLLFRVLDIVKPPPARRLERLHGGLGIMADDLMAGVYGALILWLAGQRFSGSLQ